MEGSVSSPADDPFLRAATQDEEIDARALRNAEAVRQASERYGANIRAVRESAQQSGARAGDQIVSRNLGIQPTLRVRPGWPLRVVVHSDILLRPWSGGG